MSLTPIAPETASPSPTTLILKEKAAWKSLSNDSGKIKDTDGNLVFDIDAALMTMSERRTLKDAAGKEVGQVRRKKTPGLHPAMYVGTMEEEKKCMVKTKGMLNPMKCDADIYVGDAVVGQASGNWRAKSYSFTLDGKEVSVTRELLLYISDAILPLREKYLTLLCHCQSIRIGINVLTDCTHLLGNFFRLPPSSARPVLPE